MKNIILAITIVIGFVNTSFAQLPADVKEVPAYLQEVSVKVVNGLGSGSGTVFVRDGEAYVLSAAHVVDNLRKTREVIREGKPFTVVEFDKPTVVRYFIEDGSYVGKVEVTGSIVKYSNAGHGEDLVLIKLDKSDLFTKYAVLYDGDNLPLGDELLHVGSFLGELANSFSKGYISQYGRVINNRQFFQATCTSTPGSSGGGYFTPTGAQYGVLTMGVSGSDSIGFGIGYKRVRDWLVRADALWILDHAQEVKPLDPLKVEME